jgi:hypothetical protein
MVKLNKSGTPSASAQCICAKAGGLDMMASAAKGSFVIGLGEWQASQQPWSIYRQKGESLVSGVETAEENKKCVPLLSYASSW